MTPDPRPIADPAPETTPTPQFAEVMSALASGVVLVTCRLGPRPWGTTVTAFSAVTADPPTVLVSLRSQGATARTIADTRRFGVSILAREQLDVARYGSAPGATKFLEPFAEADGPPDKSPVVAGALAHLDCELAETIQIADHTIFFGRVRTTRATSGGPPLIYQRRTYQMLAEPTGAHLPTRRSLLCLSS